MTNQQRPIKPVRPARAGAGRRIWQTPRLYLLKAGSAEAGANPVAPEGPFASGAPAS
jgi:hypothetical protein